MTLLHKYYCFWRVPNRYFIQPEIVAIFFLNEIETHIWLWVNYQAMMMHMNKLYDANGHYGGMCWNGKDGKNIPKPIFMHHWTIFRCLFSGNKLYLWINKKLGVQLCYTLYRLVALKLIISRGLKSLHNLYPGGYIAYLP